MMASHTLDYVRSVIPTYTDEERSVFQVLADWLQLASDKVKTKQKSTTDTPLYSNWISFFPNHEETHWIRTG